MHTPFRFLLVVQVALMFGAAGRAADLNGYQYDVQKTLLDKADTRGYDVNIAHLDRMMGLKVSLKNTTFKEMPASEITWDILNRKYLSTTIEHTSGKEKLQALKPGEKIELTIGAANVRGYRDGGITRKDELEWQITIVREGKEELKVNSTKSFDMLAKRAVKVIPPKP